MKKHVTRLMCPHCGLVRKIGWYEKFHGDNCQFYKENRSKAYIHEKINSYVEHHEKLLELFANYHNFFIAFKHRKTLINAMNLFRNHREMEHLLNQYKKANQSLRKIMYEENKKILKGKQSNGNNDNNE